MTVAVAVAEAAVAEGLARAPIDDIVQQVRDAMWQPGVPRDPGIMKTRYERRCSCSC